MILKVSKAENNPLSLVFKWRVYGARVKEYRQCLPKFELAHVYAIPVQL